MAQGAQVINRHFFFCPSFPSFPHPLLIRHGLTSVLRGRGGCASCSSSCTAPSPHGSHRVSARGPPGAPRQACLVHAAGSFGVPLLRTLAMATLCRSRRFAPPCRRCGGVSRPIPLAPQGLWLRLVGLHWHAPRHQWTMRPRDLCPRQPPGHRGSDSCCVVLTCIWWPPSMPQRSYP